MKEELIGEGKLSHGSTKKKLLISTVHDLNRALKMNIHSLVFES
jgi:hypothetical protein